MRTYIKSYFAIHLHPTAIVDGVKLNKIIDKKFINLLKEPDSAISNLPACVICALQRWIIMMSLDKIWSF